MSFRDRYKKLDPGLLDKMIHALSLVEALKTAGLEFIFKGGTSLMLLLNDPQRFSVDIDIITENARGDIENALEKICKNFHFLRFELDKKRSYSGSIPKAHYFIYYRSGLRQKGTAPFFLWVDKQKKGRCPLCKKGRCPL